MPDTRLLPLLKIRIDEGEAEAVELARKTNASLLLIDDLRGRTVATEMGLPITGLLGILAEERIAGRIATLKAEIDRLRIECHFFIAPDLEAQLLKGVGER